MSPSLVVSLDWSNNNGDIHCTNITVVLSWAIGYRISIFGVWGTLSLEVQAFILVRKWLDNGTLIAEQGQGLPMNPLAKS